MSIQVKGTVIEILKVETGTSKAGKEFSKQEFVVETNEQFPKKICMQVFGDKLSLLNGISQGQEVEVWFNVESREYNSKWYHTISAWKIESNSAMNDGSGLPKESSIKDHAKATPFEPTPPEGNDLPF